MGRGKKTRFKWRAAAGMGRQISERHHEGKMKSWGLRVYAGRESISRQDEDSIFRREWPKLWSVGHLSIIPLLRKLEKRFLKYATKAKTASLGKNAFRIKDQQIDRYTSHKGIPSVKEQKVIKSWREFVFSNESPLWRGVNREQSNVLCYEFAARRLRPDERNGEHEVDVLARFPKAYCTVNSKA